VNKKIGYLITVSRKLRSPLCGVIISRAGAGKSRLLETLAELVPPEDLVSYTRITPQALYYADNRSFKHKLMVSGEDEGLSGLDYALRELISAKRIRLAAPLKDAATGKMKTVEYEVEGPISLLFSTTKPAIHYENATRCFILSLDESGDQTEQIHVAQRLGRTLDGLMGSTEAGEIKRKHRNAQRLLQPLAVVNPFAPELSFPTYPLEMRREHEKYLSLIEAIALLRQHQRERKKCVVNSQEVEYIEVAVEDIEEANALMTEILGTRADELARPSRELLKLVRKMVEEKSRALEIEPRAYRFNRRDIREYTSWSDNQIKAHIGQLEELEYLLVSPGERGRMYRYELSFDGEHKDKKRLAGLTDTAKLRAKVGKLGLVGSGWMPPAGADCAGKSNGSGPESWKVGRNGEGKHTGARSHG
jgi:energy-coupling factor transporter ATP-binding protein EcfA2